MPAAPSPPVPHTLPPPLAFQRFIGDLGAGLSGLLGLGSNSTLQPTVGVSFGLPQNGAGGGNYGGYPQNPLGTGAAVNPYYDSPNGLSVGAVDVNPLVSFQATTGDEGQLVAKPLINLHVTPNGCGILGCDFDEEYHGHNRKRGGPAGLLDFLFPKKRRHSNIHGGAYDDYHRHQGGFAPSQPYNPAYEKKDYHYDHRQEPVYHHEPAYHQPQPQPQQPAYRPAAPAAPVYQEPAYRPPAPTKSVTFRHEESPQLVRHEHHHFHHHNVNHRQNGNYNNNGYLRSNDDQQDSYRSPGGISFGYRDGPFGRSSTSGEGEKNKDVAILEEEEEEETDPEESNNVKRNIFGEEDKTGAKVVLGSVEAVPVETVRMTPLEDRLNGKGKDKLTVRFPEGRSIDRRRKRSPDGDHLHHSEEDKEDTEKLRSSLVHSEQEEEILPVREAEGT